MKILIKESQLQKLIEQYGEDHIYDVSNPIDQILPLGFPEKIEDYDYDVKSGSETLLYFYEIINENDEIKWEIELNSDYEYEPGDAGDYWTPPSPATFQFYFTDMNIIEPYFYKVDAKSFQELLKHHKDFKEIINHIENYVSDRGIPNYYGDY